MIDPNIDGILPNEKLHDMRRDLRSSVGGGLSGTGPRGEGVFLVSGSFTSEGDTRTAPKSAFANPTGKASYGIRIGDVVIFGETDAQTGKGQLCTGLVTAISNDVVTFTKHTEITTEGFSPTISVSEIEGGHRITVTNDGGVITSFDVMDGEKGDRGDAFVFSDFTNEQLSDLRSDIASVYYRKREAYVTLGNAPVTSIPIPFSNYSSGDILFVDINGLSLCEGLDYFIDGNVIRLYNAITHDEDVVINFKLLTVVAMTQQDLESIVASAIVDDVANIILNQFSSDFPVATQETNGLMSAADKTKLDNTTIEGRQTQTAGYQRVKVGEGYADVALMDSNTGLINVNNIPTITTNKLADGSVTPDKLADAVRKGYVRAFDTVADMQAAVDLKAGMVCHTNGFHAAGDSGAAYYTIDTTGTANGMDVLALQGGLYATLVVTEPYVTPEMFGAWGDGTHDDVTAVQGCIDYATTNSLDVRFSVGKTYLVSVSINIGAVNVFMNSPILYKSTGAAITIGSISKSVARRSYKIWVISGNVEYMSGSIGLQVYNATNCNFNVHTISGFEYGAIFSGYDRGFGYNHVSTDFVYNCMYSITLRSDGTSGWCNENYFYNGRLAVVSSASYKNSFIGITIDSDHAYMANANTFSNMSIEEAAICIHVVYGNFNTFTRIRSEAAALVFKDENSSNWNYVNVSYGTVTAETSGAMDVVDGYQRNYQALSMPVFDSGFLPSKSFSNGNFLWAGKDICFMDADGVLKQVYKGVKYNDHIHLNSRNIGVMVDTTSAKKFSVTAMPYNQNTWRVFVVCYDADGNYINTGLKSNANRTLTTKTGTISNDIPCWVTGSNSLANTFFEVPSNCVKAFMGIILASDICGFKILSDFPRATVMGNQVSNGLTSIPTCEGKTGDFCPSSATDNTVGWLYNGTEWVAIS